MGLQLCWFRNCYSTFIIFFDLRDAPAGDANQSNLDYAETEADPKSPTSVVDSGTPEPVDETPPPPDNQLGYESWERWVAKLNILIWWNPVNTCQHNS